MIEKDKNPERLDFEESEPEFFQPPAEREEPGETARKTGLALSAGITLFGSVLVMLVVGYLVDRFFNSSPYGLVGGIILGSILGFIQFFRQTSQILRK